MTTPIALVKCSSYEEKEVQKKLYLALEKADIKISPGSRILLKPNLLAKRPLACTSPQVVSTIAKWLLDNGAKITVADSPAFGNIGTIAQATGLTSELKKLGLKVETLSGKRELAFLVNGKKVGFPVSPRIFENNRIFSVCRVKAHSQMRLTLSVKNCFGVIPGLHKAFIHAKYGQSTEFFASCITALYKSLPPVTGIADGIVAMSGTGPVKGNPCKLELLGVCSDPVLLDLAIMKILNAPPDIIPLALSIGKTLDNCPHAFPVNTPEDFAPNGFIMPSQLKPASFAPWHLFKSCLKRIWTGLKP